MWNSRWCLLEQVPCFKIHMHYKLDIRVCSYPSLLPSLCQWGQVLEWEWGWECTECLLQLHFQWCHFPSPACQSTLAASGMAIVGPIPQMQFPLNPFHSLSSADSTLTVAPTSFTGIASTFVCITNSETSSQSVPRTADLCQVPLMSQVLSFLHLFWSSRSFIPITGK